MLRLQRDWCDLPLVIDAAVACLPPSAGPLTEVSCDAGLPVVWADHDRLEQVVVNLLSNAFGHNPPGTRAAVSARAADRGEIVLSVTDDGAGMPPELASGPFEPARRRRTPTSGAGLGLSITRGIVAAHGGRIELAAQPRGTCFADLAAGRGAGRDHGPAPGGPVADRSHPRCMTTPSGPAPCVVEDDPNIVDLIRSNLAVRGFDTVVSADGLRALRLLETEEPDIVLLDLMLPEVDGFELCRQIREHSAVAIIVVSARGGERDKVTALNVGADDYMTKPFSIEELLARITATLRRTRPAAAPEVAPTVITVGDLVVDLSAQQVSRDGPGRAPDPDRVRAAARAGRQPGQAADPRPPAAPGMGPRVRDRDRVRPGLRAAAAGQAGDRRRRAGHPDPAAGRDTGSRPINVNDVNHPNLSGLVPVSRVLADVSRG